MILRSVFTLLILLWSGVACAETATAVSPDSRHSVIIRHTAPQPEQPFEQGGETQVLKIALLSSPNVIGKYSQSIYNVSLATLMGLHKERYDLKHYEIANESSEAIEQALIRIRNDGYRAILAPLTAAGAHNLLALETHLPIFVPTVHRRDVSDPSENIVFGSIDYESQIEALKPYMSNSIAIFYDKSPVGESLKSKTESLFLASQSAQKSVAAYPIDIQGDKIVSYLAKPSAFRNKSIVVHIPVVKTSLLAAHLTFTGVKEKNILSTQINVDPTLLTLTQYNDRKNMILANSLIEFPDAIYQANEMMGNDLSFDWVNYASSVGIDYLVSQLDQTSRNYSLRILNSQVIYPIRLVRPKEFGFEPL